MLDSIRFLFWDSCFNMIPGQFAGTFFFRMVFPMYLNLNGFVTTEEEVKSGSFCFHLKNKIF